MLVKAADVSSRGSTSSPRSPRRVFLAAALLATAALLARPERARAQAPGVDAADVAAVMDDLFRSKHSTGKLRLVVIKPERTTELSMRVWTQGEEKALVRIEAPARERGVATLRVEQNLWQFMPKISRTIRIPPSMLLSSWMGSDFTNDDLVRTNSYRRDFDAKLVGPAEDPKGFLVTFTEKEGRVGLWKRIDVVMRQDGAVPLAAKYYDRKGRLARTMTFSEVKTFDGRSVPTHLVLTTTEHPEKRSELHYDDLDFSSDVPDNLFSLSELERRR